MNDNRLSLRSAGPILGVVGPGDLQSRDIRLIELIQIRVTNFLRSTAIRRPVLIV